MVTSHLVLMGLIDGASGVDGSGSMGGFHVIGAWLIIDGANATPDAPDGDDGRRGSMLIMKHTRRSMKRGRRGR